MTMPPDTIFPSTSQTTDEACMCVGGRRGRLIYSDDQEVIHVIEYQTYAFCCCMFRRCATRATETHSAILCTQRTCRQASEPALGAGIYFTLSLLSCSSLNVHRIRLSVGRCESISEESIKSIPSARPPAARLLPCLSRQHMWPIVACVNVLKRSRVTI